MTVRTPLCTVRGCPHPSDPDFHVPICGHGLEGHHHHVKKRSHGGTKGPQVFICPSCHEKIDAGPWGNAVLDLGNGTKLYRIFDYKNATILERAMSAGDVPAAPSEELTTLPALMDGEGVRSTDRSPTPSPFSLASWLSEGERLLTAGLKLKGLTDEWRYEMGDWVATGEKHLHEEAYGHFSRFEDAFGASHLRALGWVAASVTRETRQMATSWSAARTVAALPESDQRAALITAREEGLSTRELAVLVRPAAPERERHRCPLCMHEHYAVVESEWKA